MYVQHNFSPRNGLGMVWSGGVVFPSADIDFVMERKFLASFGTQIWAFIQ